MIEMIMELVRTEDSLILLDSNQSKLRRQKNGSISRRSVLALLLSNIYTCDLPSAIRMFAFAADLAFLHYSGD